MESFFTKISIGKPASWLVNAAASIGLDYSGLTHEMTGHFKIHTINRHGDPAKHGAATITETDFGKIPVILETPQMAIIGANRRDKLYNIYVTIEGKLTYFYFEEVLNSNKNKVLRSVTFYKITRPLTAKEIFKNVIRNRKTNISNAIILNNMENAQTAGGHPGEEA